MKCVIIDDEPYAVQGLTRYISCIPELELAATYTDPLRAMMEINSGSGVDLVFLDINMPNISGLELSKEIRKKAKKIVFTTAYSEYAYEAMELGSDGYLLKPYTIGKFTSVVGKLFQQEKYSNQGEIERKQYFFVKTKGSNPKLVKIMYEEVFYVESDHNYVKIHLKEKEVISYMSLAEISEIFTEDNGFYQFQRSFILAAQHMESIEGNTIKMNGGKSITVGQYYRKSFSEFLSKVLIKPGKKV